MFPVRGHPCSYCLTPFISQQHVTWNRILHVLYISPLAERRALAAIRVLSLVVPAVATHRLGVFVELSDHRQRGLRAPRLRLTVGLSIAPRITGLALASGQFPIFVRPVVERRSVEHFLHGVRGALIISVEGHTHANAGRTLAGGFVLRFHNVA